MRKLLGLGIIGLIVLGLLIQLIPYGRDRSDPPVQSEPAWDSPATRALAQRACFDCHSNQYRWTQYVTQPPLPLF